MDRLQQATSLEYFIIMSKDSDTFYIRCRSYSWKVVILVEKFLN